MAVAAAAAVVQVVVAVLAAVVGITYLRALWHHFTSLSRLFMMLIWAVQAPVHKLFTVALASRQRVPLSVRLSARPSARHAR